nr:retrovirus-related Pol polyprotein from transposon TNT 1-94 [Tanacetum cinerariifolium]
HDAFLASSSAPQIAHTQMDQQSSVFSPPEAGLVIPVFQNGDDPIDSINHMMSFLTSVVASCFPATNNQLRTSSNPRQQATINNGRLRNSSNPRQQATIHDGRVTVQPVQGRRISYATGTSKTHTPGTSASTNRKLRAVICYNCKGECHISKQCTKTKRKMDDSLFTDKTNCAIVIPDSEETLLFTKKRHFKMLLKQKDTMVSEKKFNTKPIDYAALNQLSKDFATRFVPQSELSTEQVFCPSLDPIPSNRPTIVEVPSELPKVSMVDTSLQKLKRHLAGFDVSRKKGTVIKKLKERVKSLSENLDNDKVKRDIDEIETINIELEHRVSKLVAKNEHLKQTYKQLYDSIKLARIQSKEQCDALINQVNIKFVEIFDLNVSFQEQALVITALKEELRNLKGKAVVENAITSPTIAPKMYEIDVQPIAFRLLHNRMVHSEYLRFFGPLRNKLSSKLFSGIWTLAAPRI